ncbi:hypothetical protein Q5762_03410 [Streptomyces sp. P9(2023)]|uniref:hypothetical protein n=1 Tax=Streptomyces sp. P9(2023) TaxID=3064394 RepID=UPI0028F43A6A|nr:hypothetical protein [Streptomyces sp. P9(2023)]MDT9687403.1 hypothetical protein [Streptomyces sp. P9(2023)]
MVCALAALFLAVVVCHPTVGGQPDRPAGATFVAVGNLSEHGSGEVVRGCVNHQPGDRCVTGLQHLPRAVFPDAGDALAPVADSVVTTARYVVTASPRVRQEAFGVDLHVLQVQRI